MADDLPDAPWAASALPDAPWAGKPAAPSLSTAERVGDVPLSAGIGLVKGGIGLAGMPGDARELVSHLANKASQTLGYEIPAETVSAVLKHIPMAMMGTPTSQEIRSGVEKVTGPLYEPKTGLGELAQTGGEFLPAVLGGPESIAAKLATRVAAPALVSEGAGQLARWKAPAAEPYVRAATALAGAAGASGVAGALRGAVSPQANVAADLSRAMLRDTDTPETLLQRLQEARQVRPDATLADVGGENLRGLVERVAQTPGAGRTTVVPALTARQQGQMGRLAQDLSGLTGTSRTATQALEETMAQRAADAKPLYDIAMDFNAREVPEVVDAFAREVQSGWGKALLRSKDFRNNLQTEYGISDPTNAPLMQVIDAWKKAADDLVSGAVRNGSSNQARVISAMRDRVVGVLDEHNPAYPAARNAWAGPSKYMDAIADGRNILSSKTSAEELAGKWAAMSDAEREGYRIGAVSAIRGKMGNDPAKLGDMTKYLRSPEMRAKVAAIMPTPEAAESWGKRLGFEVGSSELTGRALGNSATARRIAEQHDASGIVGDLVMDALSHGATHGLLRRSMMALPLRVRDTLRSRSDQELANVLMQPGADLDATMRAVRMQALRSPAVPALPAASYLNSLEDRRPMPPGAQPVQHGAYARGGGVGKAAADYRSKIAVRRELPADVGENHRQHDRGLKDAPAHGGKVQGRKARVKAILERHGVGV